MTIYRGLSGVNRQIQNQYRGLSGVNRVIKEQYRGLSGVNRKIFGTGNIPTHVGITIGSGTTSVSCALPSGYAQGDLLIMAVGTDYWYDKQATTPSGWSVLMPEKFNASYNHFLTIFYKWANASEASPVSTSDAAYMVASLSAFRGIESVNQIVNAVQENGTTLTFPAVTTIAPNSMIVHYACVFGNATRSNWTNVNLTGITEVADTQDLAVAVGIKPTAGSTGNTTALQSANPQGVLVSISLKPL